MKDFTFRAYDNKNKKWLLGYEKLGGFSLFGECVFFGEWERVASDFIFRKDGKTPDDLIVNKLLTNDKQGNEVYEDDICELSVEFAGQSNSHFDIEPFNYLYTGIIHYNPSRGIHLKVKKCFDTDNQEYIKVDSKIKFVAQYRLKKIGNIFDNPELLKWKKIYI